MDISISRVQKSLLNARVNLIFYLAALALSYFSRRIFLQSLGSQFVGFTGTVGNFLGFLNLAEMGTAMAVSFALYRPLIAKDKEQIAEIVSLTGFLYRRIGMVMAAAGILLSLFLPLIFPHPGFPMGIVYFAWYSFLISSLLSYFLNYGQVLLDADQRNYVVTAWLQTTTLSKIFLQMILLSRFNADYYSWIALELIAGIVQSVFLRRQIRKSYPYLHRSARAGKEALRLHPGITRSIRLLSIHKLSDFILVSTKEFLIYVFSSLTLVAYYGNYVIVLTRVNQLLLTVLTSMQAGIGHLIAENNVRKTMSIFWEITALRYFITGVFIFCLRRSLEPFIALWLGREYVLDKDILLLMLGNVFFFQTKDTVISFVQGYGLFDDIGAPLIESALNLGMSILLGHFYGIYGVLTGSIISLFIIPFLWKPIYLFRRGFQVSVWLYWREIVKYIALLVLSWWIGDKLLDAFRFPDPYRGYPQWMGYSALSVACYSSLLFVLFYPLQGMRLLTARLSKRFLHRS